jgi:hypothetical protein
MARKFPVIPAPIDETDISYTLQHFQGATLVVGDTVYMSDEGLEVLASDDGSYYAVNAYSFIDAGKNEIGGMYGRDDTGQNVVGFRVVDEAVNDDDTVLEIASTSTTSAEATVTIQANRSGESTDTYLYLERSANSEIDIITNAAAGRVRIRPRLNLVGESLEVCDIYIVGSYFVIKYSDGGTTRYKYLALSGTGTTWSHSTAEP